MTPKKAALHQPCELTVGSGAVVTANCAELLGTVAATLRNRAQGRRDPTGAGRVPLRAIQNDPVSVIKGLTG